MQDLSYEYKIRAVHVELLTIGFFNCIILYDSIAFLFEFRVLKTVLPARTVTITVDVQRVSGSRATAENAWTSTSVLTRLVTLILTASTRPEATNVCAPTDRFTALSTVHYKDVTVDRRCRRYKIWLYYILHVGIKYKV